MFLGQSKEQKRILGPVQIYYWASPKMVHGESAPWCIACVAGATKMLLVQPKYCASWRPVIVTRTSFLFFLFIRHTAFIFMEYNALKRLVLFCHFYYLHSWQTCWCTTDKNVESKNAVSLCCLGNYTRIPLLLEKLT